MNVLLISTYELGRQPFGLASPAAWLRNADFTVHCSDLAQTALDEEVVRAADLIAFYLPMHTATRIALRVIDKVRGLNPAAHLCCYGLYAPMNAEMLRSRGVGTILGGEFEAALLRLCERMRTRGSNGRQCEIPDEPALPLERLQFVVPQRQDLPPLDKYAALMLPDGSSRVVGYTEASRGCKHLCRHCPVVPVYNGAFRVVQREVVLQDIRQQVAAGAEHITFGDPDFFNGPAHAIELVKAMRREFSGLSYDVTIKVEHLLRHADLLPVLRETGCAFVTSAIESVDDLVLHLLDKGHTRADFYRLVEKTREAGLELSPTFVAFSPWTTLQSYADLLSAIAELGLVENVAPVQLAIRLLIPAGSRLLELEEVRSLVGDFDPQALSYRWKNPDDRVDKLQRDIEAMVQERTLLGTSQTPLGESRTSIFNAAWRLVQRAMGDEAVATAAWIPMAPSRITIPYLTEPWYC